MSCNGEFVDNATGTAISTSDAPSELCDVCPGIFITFEGGEGAGKSTHIGILGEALSAHGYEVVLLREPGGTSIGESLRALVLNPDNDELCDECELLVYEAARAQLVAQVIKPALARGAVVLCDRFTDSTIAYQAFGRGLSLSCVRRANEFACQGVHPDRTILLVPPSVATGLDRATSACGADRLEGAGCDFHSRVNRAFLGLALDDPDRIRVVHTAETKSETASSVFRALSDIFPCLMGCSRDV